jgi:RNA polymerase-binding protein DksA
MDEVDLERAQQTLRTQCGATRAQVAALSAEVDGLFTAAAGSNLDDEHDPEGATLAFERAQLVSLRDAAGRQLVEIEAALQRVAAGDYGFCATCGAAIGAERLAARPAVRECISCAAGRSRR